MDNMKRDLGDLRKQVLEMKSIIEDLEAKNTEEKKNSTNWMKLVAILQQQNLSVLQGFEALDIRALESLGKRGRKALHLLTKLVESSLSAENTRQDDSSNDFLAPDGTSIVFVQSGLNTLKGRLKSAAMTDAVKTRVRASRRWMEVFVLPCFNNNH